MKIELAKLLWLDEEFIDKEAVPEAFGDRYLYANNPFFARIRNLFLSSGFRYSSEPTRFWRDYDSMSLLMLQEILDSGVVPHRDNTTTLKRFSANCPSLEIPPRLLLSLMQQNHLMHESAHCISHRMLSSQFGRSGPSEQKDEYVFVSILNEAYANTVERLGAALATSDPHKFFYMANSYADCHEELVALLRDSLRIFGLPKTFMAGMLVSFYLNTHEDNPQSGIANIIIDAVSGGQTIPDSERALMRIVINHGFGLSKAFRTQTNPLFFRYVGCEKQFEDLCRRPFDLDTVLSTGVEAAISELSAATCQGVQYDASTPSTVDLPQLEMEGALSDK